MLTTLPNTHALLIGIAAYQHINPLPPAVINDVRSVMAVQPRLDAEYAALLGHPIVQSTELVRRTVSSAYSQSSGWLFTGTGAVSQ